MAKASTKKPSSSIAKQLESGHQVELTLTNQTTLLGTVVQSKDNVVQLKLKNGYNVGIRLDHIKSIQVLATGMNVSKAAAKTVSTDPQKPTIVVLHTGGTIASRVDYKTGGVSSSFEANDLLSMYPELFMHFNVVTEHISNMWSDDMRFAQYTRMAASAEKHIQQGVKGIIIGHGTDTLAYTAAALSFMIQNSPIPILLVGSQRSSDRPSSDARVNLISAANFIHQTNFGGVAICMHENEHDDTCVILPATKSRKNHTSKRSAFEAVNAKPLARIHYPSGQVEELTTLTKQNQPLLIRTKLEEKVGLIKIYPNMHPEPFKAYEQFKGLVIEGTGLGHAPTMVSDSDNQENEKVRQAIEKIIQKGCAVVMTSQCVNGRVNMNVYDKGIQLQQMGIIPGNDMLPETAFVKLAFVLANYPKNQIKEKMQENLVGEITNRSELNNQ